MAKPSKIYFPEGSFKSQYKAKRYSGFLEALEEPILFEEKQGSFHRLLWLGDESAPLVYRIIYEKNKTVLVVKEGSGKGSGEPGKLVDTRYVELSDEQARSIFQKLEIFWDLPVKDDPQWGHIIRMDGQDKDLVLESMTNDQHHVMTHRETTGEPISVRNSHLYHIVNIIELYAGFTDEIYHEIATPPPPPNSAKNKTINQEEFEAMLRIHQKWVILDDLVEKNQTENNCLEISNCDLTGLNFTNKNLKEVHFHEVNLTNANLEHVDFSDADISGSLTGTRFHKAIFRGCTLSHQDLEAADLSEVNFEKAKLFKVNFSKANLHGTNFKEAKLGGASFEGANIEQVNFENAVINGVDFRKASGLNPEQLKKAEGWKMGIFEPEIRQQLGITQEDIQKNKLHLKRFLSKEKYDEVLKYYGLESNEKSKTQPAKKNPPNEDRGPDPFDNWPS